MPLKELTCRNAKPQDRIYRLFDGGGLYLEVKPGGQKKWRLKYRIHGIEKRLSLGSYPGTSLAEARVEREAAKKQIEKAVDPSDIKKEELRLAQFNSQQTFELVAIEWHNKNKSRWSESHASDILHRLKKDAFPKIGKMPISKITPPIIYACVDAIQERGAEELARRALQYIGRIFRYGAITGRVERDITSDLKGILDKKKANHFASIRIDELPDFIQALTRNEARLFRQTILAIKLLMLTFVRTKELIGATWDEIDFDKKMWTIPSNRMKMRKEHFVPLSNQSMAILQELKKLNGMRAFIFPSISKSNKHMSNNTILKALEAMKYKGKMTGHGFRSLAMSAIKEKLSYRHEVIDRQLAHQPQSKVDKAYDRAHFLEDRKAMMQQWADYLEKCGMSN